MKRIAVLAAAAALLMVLSSCGMLDGAKKSIAKLFIEQSSGPAAEVAAPEEPKEVSDDITVGVTDFDVFNPLISGSPTVRNVCGFVFEPLFRLDENMKAVPVLAQSCSKGIDGRSINIYLKQNVMWHDGSSFTARDAVYTIQVIRNGGTVYTALAEPIESVWAQDETTLCVTFSRSVPCAEALFVFPIIKNNSRLEPDAFKPIGTGPFGFTSGQILTAFDGYHNGRAKLNNVFIRYIPDVDKLVSLFNASEIDYITSDQLDVTNYIPKSNAKMYDTVTGRLVFAGFNAGSAKTYDAATRRALSLLIDRSGVAARIFARRAVQADYAVNPRSWLCRDKRSNIAADYSAASALLNEGGWKQSSNGTYYRDVNGSAVYLTLEILVNSDSAELTAVAESVAESLRSAGIKAAVAKYPSDAFYARIAARNYEMFVNDTELTPNNDITALAGTGYNPFGYSNPDVDALLQQMGTVSADADIEAVASSLYEKVRDESPFAPICYMRKTLITSSKLKSGVTVSAESYIRATENWSVE